MGAGSTLCRLPRRHNHNVITLSSWKDDKLALICNLRSSVHLWLRAFWMRRTVIVGTALLTLPVGQLEGPRHLGFWPCFLLRHCDPILVCGVEVYELAQHVHGSTTFQSCLFLSYSFGAISQMLYIWSDRTFQSIQSKAILNPK